MNLVFAIDAIFPPLTGIGRYAFELATRLQHAQVVDSVRFMSMWRWVDVNPGNEREVALVAPGVLAAFRRWLASQAWAIAPYDVVSDRWRAQMLRGLSGAVYHSPNYFLAPYEGPSVATVHDLSILRYPETHPAARRRYFDLAFERSLARATKLITPTETVRQELISEYGLAPDLVRAVLNGVDPMFRPMTVAETLPVLQRHGLKHGAYTLSVATVEPRKRLGQLIAAYSRLSPDLRRAHPLVLIGSLGWLNASVQRLIEHAAAQGWLHFLGYVSQADLPGLYAGARAYAMTSIYEGFGLPVLEAMASGVPVLTSSVSCMPEVAAGAALLAHPDDLDQLGEQLERLLTDDVWRSQVRPAGLARAQALTWARCLEQTVEVYRSVA